MRPISVARPWFGPEEIAAVTATIESGWVAQGPRVAEFEARFADLVGARHAVALSSCTTALHLSLVLAGIGPGDEVVVPSFSFIATANAATYVGATPVFADVEAATGNLTPDTVAAVVTERTRAVILVHQGGVPADVASLRRFCTDLDITVVEDAACAAGSMYHDAPVGTGAQLATWSFHPRKLITTGEGGMLTTDDEQRATRARRLREHAMSVSAADRHGVVLAPPEEYGEIGFNYRMTDLQAALGLVQLDRLPAIVERRREIVARYRDALSDLDGLRPVCDPPWGQANFQSFWVEVGPEFATDREGLLDTLAAHGISARRGIMAAHRQPAYSRRTHAPLPVTERLSARTLILPVFHEMTAEELDWVVGAVRVAARGRR